MDLISVIMPFYKKRDFFYESFKSVISQSYQNLEIIIVFDDTNTDDLKYIRSVSSEEKRAVIIENKSNLGASKSRNLAVKLSKGKYIAFIDCDDIWKENKLEVQYKIMKENNLRFSHSNYNIIDTKNNLIGKCIVKKFLKYDDLINSCDIGLSSVMVDRKIFEISMFKEIKTKEDYALWLELARKKETIYGINQSLASWRKTPNSLSGSIVTKVINGFKVYYKYEKKNLFISFFLVINLGLNYLKKQFKQKKNI